MNLAHKVLEHALQRSDTAWECAEGAINDARVIAWGLIHRVEKERDDAVAELAAVKHWCANLERADKERIATLGFMQARIDTLTERLESKS